MVKASGQEIIDRAEYFQYAKNTCYIMRESKGIVAWKARWSSRLLASEANVKTNGEEKR